MNHKKYQKVRVGKNIKGNGYTGELPIEGEFYQDDVNVFLSEN